MTHDRADDSTSGDIPSHLRAGPVPADCVCSCPDPCVSWSAGVRRLCGGRTRRGCLHGHEPELVWRGVIQRGGDDRAHQRANHRFCRQRLHPTEQHSAARGIEGDHRRPDGTGRWRGAAELELPDLRRRRRRAAPEVSPRKERQRRRLREPRLGLDPMCARPHRHAVFHG